MKRLAYIRLVQFFLYEKQEIEVGHTCGVFGANGSGKSSLIDAVQLAMFGASTERGRGVALNAQAEESVETTRTVRAYCLGQHGDAADARVRDHATTYITLVWKDTETGETLSSGLCISASADKDGHDVLGRYVLRGDLALHDHLVTIDNEERPRDWAAFRHLLQQRAGRETEVLFHEPKRFVTALLFALRGSAGPASYEAFRQAFRFGLRMRFDRSVDSIVRHQVLEARPTNISRFKGTLSTFQQIAAQVRSVQRKIDESEQIQVHFEDAHKSETQAIAWDALHADARLQVAMEDLSKAEEAAGRAGEACDVAHKTVERAKDEENQAERAKDEASKLRDGHAAHGSLQALQEQQVRLEKDRDGRRREYQRTLGAVQDGLELIVPTRDAHDAKSDAACAESLRHIVPLRASERPAREEVESTVRAALKALLLKYNETLELQRQHGVELEAAKKDAQRERDNKERVAKGKASLMPATYDLQRALADARISATPVCELVRVTDEAWQPVIESFLGTPNMQALLVDEADERGAFTVYRAARVFEAKIVLPSRFKDRLSPKTGSVAELIGGHNAAAVNYLRSKLGEFQRAQTEEDCFSHRQAMTADGMVVAGGEILRKRPVDPSQFQLGPMSESSREAATQALRMAVKRESDAQMRYDETKAIAVRLAPLVGSVDEKAGYLLEAFDAWQEQEAALRDVQHRLQSTESAEYKTLCEAADAAAKVFAQCRIRTNEANTTVGSAQSALKSCQEEVQRCKRVQQDRQTASEEARAVEGYDAAYASEHWERLLGRLAQGQTFHAIALDCERRAKSKRDEARVSSSRAQTGLVEFSVRHNETLPETVREDWRIARDWLRQRTQAMIDTGLKEQKEKMEEALEAAKRTFRTDVAVSVNANIEWMELAIRRMNDALAAAPVFSNGERYRFLRPVRPAYARLLKFVRDVAQYGPEDDLIGGAGEIPPEFEDLMLEKAEAGNAAARTPLDDYREFYDFDVEVLRVDPDTGEERRVSVLSRRVGSASGGEHRAPLYVIAGAAMAFAYRTKRGDNCGLRLLMLDEAFIKMDANNVIATMRYFEELGLQIFLTSAGEAQGHLDAFLDRYYDIMRDSQTNVVYLEGHDVSESVRQLFREDLPEFNEALVASEIAAQSREAGVSA